MNILPPTPPSEDRNLTPAEAKEAALQLYDTDSPAVVELLLLEGNADANPTKRYAASRALEWFDPECELPETRLPEPPTLRAIRWCVYAYDRQAREAAAEAAAAHLERWGR